MLYKQVTIYYCSLNFKINSIADWWILWSQLTDYCVVNTLNHQESREQASTSELLNDIEEISPATDNNVASTNKSWTNGYMTIVTTNTSNISKVKSRIKSRITWFPSLLLDHNSKNDTPSMIQFLEGCIIFKIQNFRYILKHKLQKFPEKMSF